MTVFHSAVADDDVLTWDIPLQSVAVSATLDSYAVVACMECATVNDNVLTTLRVAAITVRSFVPDLYSLDKNVLTQQWMNNPEWRVKQCYVLYGYTLTVVEIDKLWTKTFVLHITLFNVSACLSKLEQQRTTDFLAFLELRGPAEAVFATPFPPCCVRATTIDSSFSGNSDVLFTVGINTWAIVHAVHSFPTGLYNRIKSLVENELEFSVLLYFQIDIALQTNGTSVVSPGWNDNLSTALL